MITYMGSSQNSSPFLGILFHKGAVLCLGPEKRTAHVIPRSSLTLPRFSSDSQVTGLGFARPEGDVEGEGLSKFWLPEVL